MRCRCCGAEFSEQQLLVEYKNMPKSAQNFPDVSNLQEDCGVDLRLVQCPFCGMVQLDGEPVSYFRDVIRATAVSAEMTAFRTKQFADWVDRHNLKGKKVLEVGCGCGEYMNIMQTTGANVFGIEHSRESVRKAQNAGYKVCENFIEDANVRVEGAPYDAFYIMSFLEHISSPCKFLRGIAGNLSDGAVGLVEVPNFNMILQKNLCSELIQDHLLYFTSDTLRRLLEWNGFEVLSCKSIWHDYILSAEVIKRKKTNVSDFQTQYDKIKNSVDSWLAKQRAAGGKIAVWGAGHQSLASLSMFEMANSLACVIDSAEFKQNKFTPATHLPIVAPSVLDKKEIGAVLVMAASYSHEVAQIIKEKYPWVSYAILGEDGLTYEED